MQTFIIRKVRWTSINVLLFLLVASPALFASSRGEIHGIAVSPDGKTLAVAYMKGKTGFIYMISMETGVASRLTDAKAGKESSPAFSADGRLLWHIHTSPIKQASELS